MNDIVDGLMDLDKEPKAESLVGLHWDDLGGGETDGRAGRCRSWKN